MTYRTNDVPVDGGSLRVAEWGPTDGPVIVAIHGITASHLAWAAVAEAMPDVRIIAPDLRGRGASSRLPGPWGMSRHAFDVIAVLDALGLERAPIVGHSMGAFVTNVIAHLFEDRVSATLLVDGGLTLALPRGLAIEHAAQALGPAADRLSMTFPDHEAYRAFWKTHPALQEHWSPLIEAYVDYDLVGEPPTMRSRISADAMTQDAVDLYGTTVVAEAVAAIRTGTTLLTAPRGLVNETPGLYSPAAIKRWTAELPGLTIVEVSDVNHYAIVMDPRGAAVVAEHARALLG